jgi:predicted Rossmann-fold nucleotide-binding protein
MAHLPPDASLFSDAGIPAASYIPADHDLAFLQRDELRPLRFGLELLKPELIQKEEGIRSTIVVFGSSRLLEPQLAREQLAAAQAELQPDPNNTVLQQTVALAQRHVAFAHYYDEAREFGRLVSSTCQIDGQCEYVIVTGGRSRHYGRSEPRRCRRRCEIHRTQITLPQEQRPNAYVTTTLCFQFRYFALRKMMHFLLRAKALVAFPGSFGTIDELFETLTLLQTRKASGPTVILVGRTFWDRLINWNMLVEEGLIRREDLGLFHYAESAHENMGCHRPSSWSAVRSMKDCLLLRRPIRHGKPTPSTGAIYNI